MIRCVVFDFDGTLVLSNDIKREGFFAAVAGYADGTPRMERILASPPGDRYAILRCFAEEAGGDADQLAACYSAWCEEQILVCPERSGASQALDQLRSAGFRIHVNSATPTGPLRQLVARRYGKSSFDGIHGGLGAKLANLETIRLREHLLPAELTMVGDGIDDRDAAHTFGCRFIGVAGGTLAAAKPDMALLDSLEGLWPRLRSETVNEMQA